MININESKNNENKPLGQKCCNKNITKILHIGPFEKPSNAYLRSMAFESMGYVVERVDTSVRILLATTWLSRLKQRIMRSIYWKRIRVQIESKIINFVPDLVYVEKGLFLNASDVNKLRAKGLGGMIIVHSNADDPFGYFNSGWARFIDAIPAYDIHFVPKEENKLEYIKCGARSVYVYDRSFDPESHHPVSLSDEDFTTYGSDVGFIGSYASDREQILAEVIRAGVPLAIWGDGWSKGRFWREIKPSWRGGTQVGDAYAKAICGMGIALHFLRRENRDLQDSRTFEIPACGSFMLAERSADHERLFQDGVEAVYFDSTNDLLDKIHYFLEHTEESIRIAKAGHYRAYSSGYDHRSRLAEFLTVIKNSQLASDHPGNPI